MNRVEAVRTRAEELAMQLLENNLTTSDPMLVDACNKLRPFQAKLGKVDRALIQRGLGMVEIEFYTDDDEYESKRMLNELVKKLEGMKSMFGLFF